jgi:mono/diheme cytochrome c family protein
MSVEPVAAPETNRGKGAEGSVVFETVCATCDGIALAYGGSKSTGESRADA